ncbi:ATP-binding protein [Pseudarthrobacter phenanthrenivorans]|uniref:ATP-binding protein n=1 Tax=Pseudarthrobacter phenanthrenivorans TaxID=361575 RepID=UPI00344B8686
MPKDTKVVLPDTSRVIEGFRDTGYTFDASIADIIDNSIGPGSANNVAVTVGLDPSGNAVVQVVDDGVGMDLDGLENAMRYGAERQTNPNSLSKFGLGMKTASTQFCKRLVVISRPSSAQNAFAAAWDLDNVVAAGEWILEHGPADVLEAELLEDGLEHLAALSGTAQRGGTMVVWQKVDRLLKTRGGKEAKNRAAAMSRTKAKLRDHLRMVFQRFLDPGDTRARDVNLYLNGEKLLAWDPFAEGKGGDPVRTQEFKFEDPDGGMHTALLRAFILPRKDEVEDLQAWQEARISLERQGIYLYRENRLIDGPSWLGTGAAETHFNNLRVELSFEAQLDPIFGVGIKKSGVHIDDALIEQLTDILSPLRREANRRSRAGNARSAAGGTNVARPTEVTLGRLKGKLTVPSVSKGPDGSVVMLNKTGSVQVVGADGKPSGIVNVTVDDEFAAVNVVRKESLKDGVLWDMSLSTNNILQVELNTGHDWYQKAYLPIASNSTIVQAIEFLFYAMAQAELDWTNEDTQEMFEEVRVDVSRNLRKLVKDLPLPEPFEEE